MRILITADLHYNIPRSRAPAEAVAQRICAAGGDALVLVGDTAGRELEPMREALRLFDGFGGLRLLVPGNHCLWCRDGEDSLARYHHVLPDLAADEGFTVLDHNPQVLGGLGLAGSIGWYDYSFREHSLEIPEAFYKAKVAPGAAAWLGLTDLVDAHRHVLTDNHMEMGARWKAGQFVRLPFSDHEFTRQLAETLRAQLADLAGRVERIAVFTHHLPFRDLVPANRPGPFAFAAAYMGSDLLGEAILSCPKATDVYCGHSHWPGRVELPGGVRVVNVGSTYVEKRLEILEVPS